MTPRVDSAALGQSAEVLSQRLEAADPAASRQLATEFESLFISMMLKEMRQTIGGDLFAGDSSDVYGSLFDHFLGQHLAQSGEFGGQSAGIGVAKFINQYLTAAEIQ